MQNRTTTVTLLAVLATALLMTGCPRTPPPAPPAPREVPKTKPTAPKPPEIDAATCKREKAVQSKDSVLILARCLDTAKKSHYVMVVAILGDPRQSMKEARWWAKNIGYVLVSVLGYHSVPRTGGGVIPIVYFWLLPAKK